MGPYLFKFSSINDIIDQLKYMGGILPFILLLVDILVFTIV
jgi:hypothetical protein